MEAQTLMSFFRISFQNHIVRCEEIITFRFNGTGPVNRIFIFYSLGFDFFRPLLDNHFLAGINKNRGINKKIFNNPVVVFVGIVAIIKDGHVRICQLKFFTDDKILDMYFCLGFQENPDFTHDETMLMVNIFGTLDNYTPPGCSLQPLCRPVQKNYKFQNMLFFDYFDKIYRIVRILKNKANHINTNPENPGVAGSSPALPIFLKNVQLFPSFLNSA